MIPPRPIGDRQIDLNETGRNISNAQHGRATSRIPVFNQETGKIEYKDKNAGDNGPEAKIVEAPVF